MQNDIRKNPFRDTRWEREDEKEILIWFSNTSRELMNDSKPAFVYGNRGSGKTTLLRSICWDDLTHNKSLKSQCSLSDSKYISIYIRLPDYVPGAFNSISWEKHFPDGNHDYLKYELFSLIIELLCITQILKACHELRVEKYLTLSPSAEIKIVKDTINNFKKLSNFYDDQPSTFIELSLIFEQVIKRIHTYVNRGFIKDLLMELPERSPNELLLYVADRLSKASEINNFKNQGVVSNPYFKCCLDDCEALNFIQKKALNSLIRAATHPVSWVVCYVAKGELNRETFIPNQDLTNADVKDFPLSEIKDGEFIELCQSIAGLRISFFQDTKHSVKEKNSFFDKKQLGELFNLDQKLGSTNVNQIIHTMVRRSQKDEMRKFKALAERFGDLDKSGAKKQGINENTNQGIKEKNLPPYYEAYIFAHWNSKSWGNHRGGNHFLHNPCYNIDDDKIRRFISLIGPRGNRPGIRRKMVAPIIRLAYHKEKGNVPLSGKQAIIHLADRSVRDFLEILAEIYDEYIDICEKNTHKEKPKKTDCKKIFCVSRTKISSEIQKKSINRASNLYYKGIIGKNDTSSAGPLQTLVEALGRYTHELQANFKNSNSLATPERGRFSFKINSKLSEEKIEFLKDLLEKAVLAGYLRLNFSGRQNKNVDNYLLEAGQVATYRLHNRLAPYFNLSYRGAYSEVTIDAEKLLLLFSKTEYISIDSWLKDLLPTADKNTHPELDLEDSDE